MKDKYCGRIGFDAATMSAVVFALALSAASVARAAPVVDQSNLVDPTNLFAVGSAIRPVSSAFPFGVRQVQTVEVGLGGELTRIDLQVWALHPQGVLHASLYDGDYAKAEGMFTPPGSPGGYGTFVADGLTPLVNLPSLAQAQAGGLQSYDVRSLHFHVHPGQVLSILLDLVPGSAPVVWANGYLSDPSDPSSFVGLNYPRGYNSATFFDANFVESGADRGFRTWVDASVPEPATWAMMLVGFFGLGAAMRSRGKPSHAVV